MPFSRAPTVGAAAGVGLRLVRDPSARIVHPHAFLERDPQRRSAFGAIGGRDTVHATGDTLVLTLDPADHVEWIVLADGIDRIVIPPGPLRLAITIEG